MSSAKEQIEKLKMDGISSIGAEKNISTINTLTVYAKDSKNEVIDAIMTIVDSSPRPEVTKAGHEAIQRVKG